MLEKSGLQLVVEGEAAFNSSLAKANASAKGFGSALDQSASQANAAVSKIESGAKKAAGSMNSLFGTGSVMGVGREQFSRLGSAAALAFNAIGAGAGQANSDVGRLIQTASQLGTAFAFGGPVGAVVTVASIGLSAFFAEQERAAQAAAAQMALITAESYKVRDAILSLTAADPLQKLADSAEIGIDRLRELAKASEAARVALRALGDIGPAMDLRTDALARAQEAYAAASARLKAEWEAGKISIMALRAELDPYAKQVEAAQQAVDQAAGAEELFNQKLREQDELLRQLSGGSLVAYLSNFNAVLDAFNAPMVYTPPQQGLGAGAYYDRQARMNQGTQLAIRDIQTSASAAATTVKIHDESIRKMGNALAGAIDRAMAPTSVTEADMAASRAGTYKTKWDEFARRAEAVATGTPAGTYGPEFEAQLKELEKAGYTAERAAAAFRDFSLFSDPKNIKLVDWGPIVADVEQQLAALAGKAELTQRALSEVWAKLSPGAKANLAKIGIENQEDAFQALLDPLGAAAGKASEYAGTIESIPKDVTTQFDAKEKPSFKPAIDAAAEYIEDKIAKYADLFIQITAKFTEETEGSGGTPPGGAPPGTLPPGVEPGDVQGKASGGFGYLSKTTYFRGDPGEYYWFSGSPLNPSMFPPWAVPLLRTLMTSPAISAPQAHYTPAISPAQNFQFDFNGPLTIREEADLKEIAKYVTRSLRGDVMSYRRVGA